MKKTVYLIRHAKSSWSDSSLKDFDRPLNERGKRDAKFMADEFGRKVSHVDLVLCSAAKRAKKTCKKLFQPPGPAAKDIIYSKDLYHASSDELLAIIQKQADSVHSLAIVGHNPGLTDLANEIGNVRIDNLPTTGIIAFTFDVEKWKNILPATGSLLFFDYRKRFREKAINEQ